MGLFTRRHKSTTDRDRLRKEWARSTWGPDSNPGRRISFNTWLKRRRHARVRRLMQRESRRSNR